MQTKHILGLNEIEYAGEVIKNGGLVAFPTETVYGLGANGLNPEAVKKIFVAKGRPSDNPLILHFSRMEDVEKIAYINNNAMLLASAFWPGALTMVLPKREVVPEVVTAGLNTVAVRMPSNDIARALIEECGVPVAAPSANVSGKPSPTTARAVSDDMEGKIDVIIEGDACDIGIESTVIDLTGEIPVILRPGGITLEMIQEVLPECIMDSNLFTPLDKNEVPKCPGMKYKHYSPNAKVVVFEPEATGKIAEYINKYQDKKVAVYCKNNESYPCEIIKFWGEDASQMAKNLFEDLRMFDMEGVEVILCRAPEMSSMGQSVRNRLYKSAGYDIVK